MLRFSKLSEQSAAFHARSSLLRVCDSNERSIMNRVVIQSGYSLPSAFAGASKRKRSDGRGKSAGAKRQQSKMKKCAASWKRSSKRGKYTSFMKSCLRK